MELLNQDIKYFGLTLNKFYGYLATAWLVLLLLLLLLLYFYVKHSSIKSLSKYTNKNMIIHSSLSFEDSVLPLIILVYLSNRAIDFSAS